MKLNYLNSRQIIFKRFSYQRIKKKALEFFTFKIAILKGV